MNARELIKQVRNPVDDMRDELRDLDRHLDPLGIKRLSDYEVVEAARSKTGALSAHSNVVDAIVSKSAIAQLEHTARKAMASQQLIADEIQESLRVASSYELIAKQLRGDYGSDVGLTGARQLIDSIRSSSAFEDAIDQARAFCADDQLQAILREQASVFDQLQSDLINANSWQALLPDIHSATSRMTEQWSQFRAHVPELFDARTLTSALAHEHSMRDLVEQLELTSVPRILQEAVDSLAGFDPGALGWQDVFQIVRSVDWPTVLEAIPDIDSATAEDAAPATNSAPVKASRRSFSREQLALLLLIIGTSCDLINTLVGGALLERFNAREAPCKTISAEAERQPNWASVAVPTNIYSDPRPTAELVLRLKPGDWIRVLDSKSGWLLVEAERGERSRVQGWIRQRATQALGDQLLVTAFGSLQASLEVSVPKKGRAPIPVQIPTIVADAGDDAVWVYEDFVGRVLSSTSTRAAYAKAYDRFFARCATQGSCLDSLSSIHVVEYIAHVWKVGSAATAKQHLTALRKLFDQLELANLVASNPTTAVKAPTIDHTGKQPSPISRPDVERLLASVGRERPVDVRDRTIIIVIAAIGLKASEVAALKWGDIELHDHRTTVWVRRSGVRKSFAATEQAHDALTQLRSHFSGSVPDHAFVFVSSHGESIGDDSRPGLSREQIYAMVRRRSDACGLGLISCEMLRNVGA